MTEVNVAMTTLLNGIWQGTVLTFAMWLFLKLFPRLNPTTRFAVLWATVLADVLLLLAPFTLGANTPGAQADSPRTAATDLSRTLASAKIGEPGFSFPNRGTISQSRPALLPNFKQPVSNPTFEAPGKAAKYEAVPPTTAQRGSTVIAAAWHPPIRIHSGEILDAFEIMWVSLSLMMLMRLGFAYGKLRTLKVRCGPAPAECQIQLRKLAVIHGVGRQARLLVSNHIAAPTSLGFLSPAIVIPQKLLDTLSESELEHVLLHELGHVRRHDDWTNLAQKLIEAMLPIQPAVYWIGHRMSIEREMACDDWVIAATGAAASYANSLTRVAELSRWAHADVLAAGATGNRSQLFYRVHHMLNKPRKAAPRLTVVPLGAAIATIGVLFYAGVRTPQMIALAKSAVPESSLRELTASTSTQPLQAQAPRPASVPAAPLVLREPVASTATKSSTALIALTVQPSAPKAPFAPAESQQSGETHMQMTSNDGWTSFSVRIDGVIEFTDDDRDVKSLSPGGHFRMTEGTLLSGRGYDVRADLAGNLTKTYLVGSSVKPLDSEAREWLARLLPQMIRESGVGATSRVGRILRQGGPQAVIKEIESIHSDGSKRIYLEQLFSQANLNTDQLNDSAKLIRGISSDGDKSEVLVKVDGRYFTGELRPKLFEAVESISSDGDRRRVLSDILKKDAGSTDTLLGATKAAGHISSDGDKAEVLIEIARSYLEAGGLGMTYFEAVKSISSDGDHARVLMAMLAAHGDDQSTLCRVLKSAANISSDGDKARVLREAVPRYSDNEPINKAFMAAANSISSDGDHQQVLVALAHRPGIDTATIGEIAKSAQRISSDGDKARVLVELVAANLEPARESFFAAADTIQSDGDHSRVLLALLDKSGTSAAMAIGAIQSATRISSDGDKGRVFVDAARRYLRDPQVDAALRKAVESLHSDSEFRAVMNELTRRAEGN